jgi:hypothetical protein
LALATGLFAVWSVHRLQSAGQNLPSYAKRIDALARQSPLDLLAAYSANAVWTGDFLCSALSGQGLRRWYAALIAWPPTLLGMMCCARRKELLHLSIVLSYLLLMLSMAPVMTRYLLPVLPFLVLYFIDGVVWLSARRAAWRGSAQRVAVTCAVVLIAMNAPKLVRNVYRQHVPEASRDYRHSVLAAEAAAALQTQAKPGDRFVADLEQHRLAYLSGVPSIPLSDRKLCDSRYRTAQFEALARQRVRLVVQGLAAPSVQRKDLARLCRAYDYRVVFENKAFRIYVAPPEDAAAERPAAKARPVGARG